MTRIITLLAATLLTLGLMAAPAVANHEHAKVLQNGAKAGDCVVLAGAPSAEKWIENPRWDGPDGVHPLHNNVHVGTPTQQGALVVIRGDFDGPAETIPCPGDLLNAP